MLQVMLQALPRILAACAVVMACSHTDAAARDAHSTAPAASNGSASASSAAATGAPSAGAVMPHDSISDRADRGRIMGDSTAPVWLIMASDFQCPYCKQWHDASFASIVHDFANTGRVRIAFLNMPLSSIHPHAKVAAEMANVASITREPA